MEAGMKVVFSSIINGTSGNWPANEATGREFDVIDKKDCFKPEISFSQPKPELDDFKEKSAQEVFESLINASNCANLQAEKALDGYLTFTPAGAFLREYLI